MKSKEVIRTLHVTRPTLTKYVKTDLIKVTVMPNGRYDYNDADVLRIANKGITRETVVYARVSTYKQKAGLENQVSMLKQFCFANGWHITQVYEDVASGISFEKRDDFFKMLDEILEGRVERVVISYKDRLSRVGFELFSHLFARYHCKIVVVSDVGNNKLDSEEIFEEIISLLHCYSMKLYSKRRVQKIKEALDENGAED